MPVLGCPVTLCLFFLSNWACFTSRGSGKCNLPLCSEGEELDTVGEELETLCKNVKSIISKVFSTISYYSDLIGLGIKSEVAV